VVGGNNEDKSMKYPMTDIPLLLPLKFLKESRFSTGGTQSHDVSNQDATNYYLTLLLRQKRRVGKKKLLD
jgi:hypothetical protein